jgi:hypothetical protein
MVGGVPRNDLPEERIDQRGGLAAPGGTQAKYVTTQIVRAKLNNLPSWFIARNCNHAWFALSRYY